jgi:hypothetical protein
MTPRATHSLFLSRHTHPSLLPHRMSRDSSWTLIPPCSPWHRRTPLHVWPRRTPFRPPWPPRTLTPRRRTLSRWCRLPWHPNSSRRLVVQLVPDSDSLELVPDALPRQLTQKKQAPRRQTIMPHQREEKRTDLRDPFAPVRRLAQQ